MSTYTQSYDIVVPTVSTVFNLSKSPEYSSSDFSKRYKGTAINFKGDTFYPYRNGNGEINNDLRIYHTYDIPYPNYDISIEITATSNDGSTSQLSSYHTSVNGEGFGRLIMFNSEVEGTSKVRPPDAFKDPRDYTFNNTLKAYALLPNNSALFCSSQHKMGSPKIVYEHTIESVEFDDWGYAKPDTRKYEINIIGDDDNESPYRSCIQGMSDPIKVQLVDISYSYTTGNQFYYRNFIAQKNGLGDTIGYVIPEYGFVYADGTTDEPADRYNFISKVDATTYEYDVSSHSNFCNNLDDIPLGKITPSVTVTKT